ncbi:MAG: sucrase ferredoxin [Polyangiales bacterium]
MNEPRCSAVALQLDEPLAGTAVDSVDSWFLLEVNDTWAPKAIETEALSPGVRRRLQDWLEATPNSRLQLIRRPGRASSGSTFMWVSAAAREITRVDLSSHEAMIDLDLDDLRSASVPMTTPICLVCVHGRRDRCCAQHGGAVFRAVCREDVETWQTSHLGGHRFAACALWLPDGLMYGRLRAGDAGSLVDAHRNGQIGDPAFFRGRCEYDRPTQAGEVFLRDRLGERALGALEWRGTEPAGTDAWTVRFAARGEEHVVQLARTLRGDTRPPSCGADPEPITVFIESSPS